MKYFTQLIVTAYFSIILACSATESKTSKLSEGRHIDTVGKDIQLNKNGELEFHYLEINKKVRQLGLDSLQKGYDSLQIRIWMDYSIAKELHLFEFKRKDNNWSGIKITYLSDIDNNGLEGIRSKKVEHVVPKSGWSNFFTNLLILDIRTLANYENSIGGTDGTSYCIEIATADKYRYYRFWSPEYSASKNQQAAQMVKIIQLIEREFSFNRNQQ